MVNFCSHFNIEDVGNYTTFFSILWFVISRKVKMPLKCKEKSCAVYGEGAVTDGMCQQWLVKLRAGDFSPDDAPQLGRDQLKLMVIKSRH